MSQLLDIPIAHLGSLLIFALVSGITPGPNNIMLSASGFNFGLRRTLPHILGIIIGFPLLMLAISLGLSKIFVLFPWLINAILYAGCVYLVYLSYRLFMFSPIKSNAKTQSQPFSFFAIVLFQWLNPKAWVMSITAVTGFWLRDLPSWINITTLLFVFIISSIASALSWVLMGCYAHHWLRDEVKVKAFNYTLAILLMLTTLYMLLMGVQIPE